jgi:cation:H+ antiporter
MLYVTGFIVCAIVIFFAGKKLSFYGDLLAEKTGLSKGWIGLILMASVTSLPELMVGISSVVIVESADLAVGDILGSCAFNLGILAMMDAFVPKRKPLLGIASPSHMLNAGLGILMMTLVGFAFFTPNGFTIVPWISTMSIVFFLVYLIAVRIIYNNERYHQQQKNNIEHTTPAGAPFITLKKIVINYAVFAMIIILAALALPFFADHIAEQTGLGKSFVGTFMLAVSTSLPEIAVSIAAVRMGSIDMSVGNLLGSNIFNILILAIDDIFYRKGVLLEDASDAHIFSVLSTIMMSAVVVIGLSYHAKGKRFWLAWDALVIFFIYILNLIILFRLTS